MARLTGKIQGKPEQGNTTSILRIWHAFLFSVDGLRFIATKETAFKQQVIIGVFLMGLAVYLAETNLEILALISPILLCWLIEIINTSIEAVADAISEEFDANIKIAKDLGSLAVLTGFGILAFVWSVVLIF
ncbi:MAG: diacylglycerol kinase [PS1 clade bacterium]|nr:diacylglycerol kinase [PS1 clade bacterium]